MWVLLMVTALNATPIQNYKTFESCEVEAMRWRVAFAPTREVYVCERTGK